MISIKWCSGLTLIGAWVWFMGCLAPDNTTSMLQREPQKIIDVAHEVTPGHARLLLEQASEKTARGLIS